MNGKNKHLPTVIALVGLVLLALVLVGSARNDDGTTLFPLLALLAMCEFGFITALAGSYLGARAFKEHATATLLSASASCVLMMVLFALQGLELWPV